MVLAVKSSEYCNTDICPQEPGASRLSHGAPTKTTNIEVIDQTTVLLNFRLEVKTVLIYACDVLKLWSQNS